MFAKLTRVHVFGQGRQANAAAAAFPANDNQRRRRFAVLREPLRQRRRLVCRWHKTASGALECRWHIAGADGAAGEEVGISCRFPGSRLAAAGLQLAALSLPPHACRAAVAAAMVA
jgi:hypothetical protein